MKKLFLFVFITLSMLTSAQSNFQLLIQGTPEDALMNPTYSPDGLKIAYTKSGYQGIWFSTDKHNCRCKVWKNC